MSLFAIFIKGGYLMILLLILSIIAMAIILEKYIKLRKLAKEDSSFLAESNIFLHNEDLDKLSKLSSTYENSLMATIANQIINAKNYSFEKSNQFVENIVNLQLHKLEKKLGILETISTIAPLIGFLGTVMGMVKVFMKIQLMGGATNVSVLAEGIWQALLTTVGGLIVGIFSIIFYNIFVDKINHFHNSILEMSNDLLGIIWRK